jgi:hypothetical protein
MPTIITIALAIRSHLVGMTIAYVTLFHIGGEGRGGAGDFQGGLKLLNSILRTCISERFLSIQNILTVYFCGIKILY